MMLEGFLTGLIGNILKEVITQAIRAIKDKRKRLDEREVEKIVAAYLVRHQIALQTAPLVKEIYIVLGASGLVGADRQIILSPTEAVLAVIGRVTHQAAFYNVEGDLLQVLNRHSEAVIAYDQALQYAANDPAILNNKGDTLQALHRYQEAVKAYDHALCLSNDSAIYSNKQEALRALEREHGRQ